MRLDEIIRNFPRAAVHEENRWNFEAHAIYCSG
jgi:hypothetical protein